MLDQVNAMVETGVISWIAPSRCSKRDDEVQANCVHAAGGAGHFEVGASPGGRQCGRGNRVEIAMGNATQRRGHGSMSFA